jgi:hypothetical protein
MLVSHPRKINSIFIINRSIFYERDEHDKGPKCIRDITYVQPCRVPRVLYIFCSMHLIYLIGRCPRKTGYVYNDVFDSCYRFQAKDSLQHLFDYDQTCAEVGAELITIDSTAKQQHIVKHLSE